MTIILIFANTFFFFQLNFKVKGQHQKIDVKDLEISLSSCIHGPFFLSHMC